MCVVLGALGSMRGRTCCVEHCVRCRSLNSVVPCVLVNTRLWVSDAGLGDVQGVWQLCFGCLPAFCPGHSMVPTRRTYFKHGRPPWGPHMSGNGATRLASLAFLVISW